MHGRDVIVTATTAALCSAVLVACQAVMSFEVRNARAEAVTIEVFRDGHWASGGSLDANEVTRLARIARTTEFDGRLRARGPGGLVVWERAIHLAPPQLFYACQFVIDDGVSDAHATCLPSTYGIPTTHDDAPTAPAIRWMR